MMAAHSGTREYLSFKLGAEEYGIDILKVQEIRGYEPPTRIANVPEFIKGVVNLRGVIVPIIDMRVRFCMEDVQYNSFTVVIILNIARPHRGHGGGLGERRAGTVGTEHPPGTGIQQCH
jgi:purine-binding chemotaxis protein CheW